MDKTASEKQETFLIFYLQNKCLLMKMLFFLSFVPYSFFIVSHLQDQCVHYSERLENIVVNIQECSVQFVKTNRFCSDAHFIKLHLQTVLFYLQCPGI